MSRGYPAEPFPAPWAAAWGEDAFGYWCAFAIAGVPQRMRWISPGSFLMGSPEDEPERDVDETQHQVTLRQGFWMAETCCTQALWKAVTGENPSLFKGEALPVERVSWQDVVLFLAHLNRQRPDLEGRLPTEAEWEYACRAGTTGPFSFGTQLTTELANYDGAYPYDRGEKGTDRASTIPVDALPPNPWGLYQMHGNVWEWCADWYADFDKRPALDPVGPETGSERLLRGGSWRHLGGNLRSAQRLASPPSYRNHQFGFRLALGQ